MPDQNDKGLDMDTKSLDGQRPNVPYIHKVGVPPKQDLLKEFKTTVKETFFSDDPLRPFKDQPKSKKLVLGLQAIFPILDWGRSYNFRKFRGDLIAGLTIASLCIPQDIGYSKLAYVPPQYGLYSSFVPPLIYACMGSSRDIAIGPVAVVSLLLGTLLRKEVDPDKDLDDYLRLVFTATFFAGITQATLGVFRLGFLIDFLSHAAVVGFMGGAAITIALQQLKGFLGIKHFTKETDIISVMKSVFGSVDHGWNWQTIVIGASFLAFLLVAKYIGKKNMKLFWVPAIAPLISVVLSTLFVYITHANKDGVAIVGRIEKRINPPSLDKIYFSGENLLKGFRIGIVAGMIALTEAVAIGRTFAAMKDYQVDGNKEMVALGTMNVIGSMTSCYVATGSFSRSAVNYMAGCQTAVSNIVMSFVVFLTVKFLTPLFEYTPNAILSSIIISAVIGLIDYDAAILIWKIDKLDFVACMGAFLGVVFKSVETGLLIAVAISFAKILLQVTRPRTAILGKIPMTSVYRNIGQYPEATKVPGVLIVRVDSGTNWSGASGRANAASGSRSHPSNSGWMPHLNSTTQGLQRLSEFSPWTLFPSPEAESVGHRGHLSPFPTGRSSSTAEENVISSGVNSPGRHHQPFLRSASLMEVPGDEWQDFAADMEGRHRLVSEMRQILNALRRGENLRAEDYVLFDPFINGVADLHDRHRDMRLDVDNMSYEELLALEERIGDVKTGLNEEVILKSMKQRKHISFMGIPTSNLEPCCICREEYGSGDDIGSLDCGHDFHTHCIKQWLAHKNVCPICKMTALST